MHHWKPVFYRKVVDPLSLGSEHRISWHEEPTGTVFLYSGMTVYAVEVKGVDDFDRAFAVPIMVGSGCLRFLGENLQRAELA